MKGLVVFISDLRNARAKELEEKRINKELANVRQKFKDPGLSGYHKKKYVCKLLYIYILGYTVEFGHLEAVGLISSRKFSEKQIGYLAVTLFLHENHDLIHLVVNSIRKDLIDDSEIFNCLALQAIANVGGQEMGEALSTDVYQLLVSVNSKSVVRKKAALTLLRLYRKYPKIVQKEWAERIVALMDDDDLGVTLSVTSLVMALAQDQPDLYETCFTKAVYRLKTIVIDEELHQDYIYYDVPTPWLQVKLVKLLQYYPSPDDPALHKLITKIVRRIIDVSMETPKNVQQNNAQKAILFEAINLAIHIEMPIEIMERIIVLLGHFISSRETNARYLGLETMAHVAASSNAQESLKRHQDTIIASLKDRDISVRRKSLDLLYSLCDSTNAEVIVAELLKYLFHADHAIREEMVLKIAILTEKHATDSNWYIDITLQLLSIAGDHVSDEVWQRVVQVVTNNEDLQEYAISALFTHLARPDCHETLIKIGAYLLGEFGHLVAETPNCSPIEQFMVLQSHFPICESSTKGILLSTYIKFVNLFPEIRPQVIEVFRVQSQSVDSEIQQRACEYLGLATMPSEDMLRIVCDEMPPFPERASALLSQLHGRQSKGDRKTWVIGGKDANAGLKSPVLGNRIGIESALNESNDLQYTPPQMKTVNTSVNGNTSHVESPKVRAQSITNWQKGYDKLLFKLIGLLYEDTQMQIGLRSEFHGASGRLLVHFKNRLDVDFNSLTSSLDFDRSKLSITVKSILEPRLQSGQQTQQFLEIRALDLFEESPLLKVSYLAGSLQSHTLKLPVVMTRFMQPATLSAEEYFSRWIQLAGGTRELQKVFGGKSDNSATSRDVRGVLDGLNWGILDHVDPNETNFVAATVLHTENAGNFGCLLRLEPNNQSKVWRFNFPY